jgi:uncharacterized protein (DUF433 family)
MIEKKQQRQESWPSDANRTGVFWSGRAIQVAALTCGAHALIKGTKIQLGCVMSRLQQGDSQATVEATYKLPPGSARAAIDEWQVHRNAIRRAERRARDWRMGFQAGCDGNKEMVT